MESRKKAPSLETEDTSVETSTPHITLAIGELFHQTRLHKKKTIDQISSDLCIRGVYLKAIEEMDKKNLPEAVYTLGFVRGYAKYLHLDEEEAVQRFKKEVLGIVPEKSLNFPKTLPKKGTPKTSLVVMCLLVLGAGAAWLYKKEIDQKEPVPPLLGELPSLSEEMPLERPAPLPSLQEPLETLNPDPSLRAPSLEPEVPPLKGENEIEKIAPSAPSSVPVASSSRIMIQVENRSWIEILDKNGQVILDRILNPGDSYQVPEKPGLILNTGNAGGLRILVDGKPIPPLGQYGMPRRNIALEPDRLLAIPSAPTTSSTPVAAAPALSQPTASKTPNPVPPSKPKPRPSSPPPAVKPFVPKPKSAGIMPPVVLSDKNVDLILNEEEGIGSISE